MPESQNLSASLDKLRREVAGLAIKETLRYVPVSLGDKVHCMGRDNSLKLPNGAELDPFVGWGKIEGWQLRRFWSGWRWDND